MRLMIESTDKLTRIDNVPVRVWEGTCDDGTPCYVFIHRIAVHKDEAVAEFERELAEQLPPGQYVPLSMIL